MFKSIKSYIMGGVVIGSVLLFVLVYIFSYFLFTGMMESRARETSRAVSLQTFETMFQIMRRGWTRDQLNEFLGGLRSAYNDTSMSVDVYRGPIVSELYGSIEQSKPDQLVQRTILNANENREVVDNVVRFTYPLIARSECLRCHTNANVGDVLGVIQVKQDLNDAMNEARLNYILVFLLFAPVPLILAALAGNLFARRLDRSILLFRKNVQKVNRVSDIEHVNFKEMDLHFSELNQLMHGVGELVGKLRHIAVDKTALEYELKLMEKFIVSAEVVKDWNAYIQQLLKDIDEVIGCDAIYTIFKLGDGDFELEVFWKTPPGEKTKKILEEEVKHQFFLKTENRSDEGSFSLIHRIMDDRVEAGSSNGEDLKRKIEHLIVPSPKIGGIIGLGIVSGLNDENHRKIILEGILATLLNAVGTVRAVNKYTRDLEYFATRDPLTNLYNQRVFWDLLEYETGRADRHRERFALLVIDLDNFKTINDRYGHSTGDLFLKEFSRCIKENTRKEDIAARYGGDEFTIILPHSDEKHAYMIAERIQNAADSISLEASDGSHIRGTISTGITIYPDHGTTARDLFLVADNMMYRAKNEGKNTIVYPTDDDVADVFKQIGEKSMIILSAIEHRKVVPHYQPIVEVSTGNVVIHELLMRIEHEGDLQQASEFIDIAENMGVVHKLDYILLEKSFAQLRSVSYTGKIFVNLSPRALIITEFITNVKRLAQDYGFLPSAVVFEITERETVRNMALLEKFVRDLKQEGFQFAIDDFGSGFSSFSYLKRFPIDYIKIDGEFIRNIVVDSRDRAVVKSVTTLASELGIYTIAEYVESEEVLHAVEEAGIHFAQGYYLGRPSRNLIL